MEGEFALADFDQYEITLTDTSSAPKKAVVIGARRRCDSSEL